MSGSPAGQGASGWRALGASVRGAHHVRRGLPNQDALTWRPGASPGPAFPSLALAVADGHGSARHARSQSGARIAADLAADFLYAQADALAQNGIAEETPKKMLDWSGVHRLSSQNWPAALARRWSEAVRADFAAHPLTDPEAGATEAETLYGTTLLAILATPRFLVHLQIGDGDMLAVSEAGEVFRPLPPDPRCLGVSTVSLCMPDARHQFRTRFQALSGAGPALLLAATDGYGTSFASDEAFMQAGADFWRLLRAEGPDAVQASLPAWLAETSEAGSGDDVSVGLLYRPSAL